MQIIEKIKELITGVKSKENYSLYGWIKNYLSELDPEPKFKIKTAWLGPGLPWVFIQDGCYIINTGKRYDGFDIELYGFQIAAKFARKRAQTDNPQMIFFVPKNAVGIPIIDQRIVESYFDNFDDEKETDASIFSWLMAITFYLHDYPVSEIKKVINIDADDFAGIMINEEKKTISVYPSSGDRP